MKEKEPLDCTKTCRMTSQLRESQYCTGTAETVGSKVIFGCQKNLASCSEEIRTHYGCNLWNMGMYEACEVCELECIKNVNEKLDEMRAHREKIKSLKNSINPLIANYNFGNVSEISKKYKKALESMEEADLDTFYSAEAIRAAEFASTILNATFEGRMVDLNHIKAYANNMVDRVNRVNPSLNVEKINFKEKEKRAKDSGFGKHVINPNPKSLSKK